MLDLKGKNMKKKKPAKLKPEKSVEREPGYEPPWAHSIANGDRGCQWLQRREFENDSDVMGGD